MSYHGDRIRREFSVHSWEAGVDAFGVREFDHDTETFLLAGQFCSNCEPVGHRRKVAIWRCRGHDKTEECTVQKAGGSSSSLAEDGDGGDLRTAGPEPSSYLTHGSIFC